MVAFAALLMTTIFLQGASLESTSPKERVEAVEQLARPGRVENIAPLVNALKKEARSEIRGDQRRKPR